MTLEQEKVYNVWSRAKLDKPTPINIEDCCCGHKYENHVVDLDVVLSECDFCDCVWFHEEEHHEVYIRETNSEHLRL